MSTSFNHGYALLIAVDASEESHWALPDVVKDVSALREVLVHPERCAYLPDNVRVVQGEDATREGILEGIAWLRRKLKEDRSGNETAVVYFTGHGLRDISGPEPVFYLRPYDARQESLRLSALRAEDFASEIRDLDPQRLLVLLDCCHAGGMEAKGEAPQPGAWENIAMPPALFMGGAKGGSAIDTSNDLEGLARGSGRAVLSSSQSGQLSFVRKDRVMSVFTYHLIEALTGHAQPQEGASEVLVSDVMSHVWRRVPESASADWGRTQEPSYQVSGNFPVAQLLGGKPWASDQAAPDVMSVLASKVDGLAQDLSEAASRERELRLELARIKFDEMVQKERAKWENERPEYMIKVNDKESEPTIGSVIILAIFALLFPGLIVLTFSIPGLIFAVFFFLMLGGSALYVLAQYQGLKEAERAHWRRLNGFSFEDFAKRHYGLTLEHAPNRYRDWKWSAAAMDEPPTSQEESQNSEW